MSLNRFITIEGIDGAGKSTQVKFIEQYLTQKGQRVILTREPGGTQLGEQLRQILLDAKIPLSLDTEILLIFAARAEHIHQIIRPALRQGYWVISDRFTDATLAYQGGGHGADLHRIDQLSNWVQKDIAPCFTFLIDVPLEVAKIRLSAHSYLDRFENQAMDFHQRVRNTYLKIASQNPKRFTIIDGSQSIEVMQQSIAKPLDQLLRLL